MQTIKYLYEPLRLLYNLLVIVTCLAIIKCLHLFLFNFCKFLKFKTFLCECLLLSVRNPLKFIKSTRQQTF